MTDDLLRALQIPLYTQKLQDAAYRPGTNADLWNESAALQIGKWVRSLHQADLTALPDELRREAECLPAVWDALTVQSVWETADWVLQFCTNAEAEKNLCVLVEMAEPFCTTLRSLPQTLVLETFDPALLLLAKDHTGAAVGGSLLRGYRYWDVRHVCSRLHSWGQWAFLWGYAIPVAEDEKQLDALVEPLLLAQKARQTQNEDEKAHALRMFAHARTKAALDFLTDKQANQ